MENVALAGEARSAVACAESTFYRYLDAVRTQRPPGPNRIKVAGRDSGFLGRPETRGQERRDPPLAPACLGARDVSGVCAPSVHFITASKIKLGPDGMVSRAWQAWQPPAHTTARHSTAHSLTVLRFGTTALRTRHQISVPSPSHSLLFEGASIHTLSSRHTSCWDECAPAVQCHCST